MLITVSGPVGSGKSTIGATLAHRLSEPQRPVKRLNFQKLPCFRLLKRDDITSAKNRQRQPGAPTVRRANYERSRLTLFNAVVQLGRIVSFRVWRVLGGHRGPLVLNRYFYDSLSHYRLDGALEQVYLRVIRAVMPRPDLAIVLDVDVDTLASRRPEYARVYLDAATDAYRALPRHFPELLLIEPTAGSADAIVDRLQAYL